MAHAILVKILSSLGINFVLLLSITLEKYGPKLNLNEMHKVDKITDHWC